MFSRTPSIKDKLLRIYLVTIMLALCLAGSAFIVQDVYSIRQSLIQKLTIQSKIIASNASVAIFFNDAESTAEILQALVADRDVLTARITKKKQHFASYQRQKTFQVIPSWLLANFFEPLLSIKQAIIYKNKIIAEIELISDYPNLYQHLNYYGKIVTLVLFVSFLFSFFIATRMQRSFLIPIKHLVNITKKVARDKNYTLKVHKKTDDELGLLADHFNIMLEQINERDQNLEIEVKKRTEQLVELNKTLKHRAYHDILTGLGNRALFNDHVNQAIAQAERHQKRFAILFLDLDQFKLINDTMGHEFGDIVLRQTAERLSSCVRKEDTLARMGGDEFTLLIKQIEKTANIIPLVEKILQVFIPRFSVQQHDFNVKPSIGISFYPEDGDKANLLQQNADTAMYAAKAKGGNCYQFFSKTMSEQVHKRMTLEAELHTALLQDEMVLYYQPQVDKEGNTISFEALIRWVHPTKGMISPLDFISVAEETGQIIAIGQWVIEQACKQQVLWQEQGYSLLPVHINISPKQFVQEDLAQYIQSLLQRYNLPIHLIGCEVTENIFAGNSEQTVAILDALHQFGFHLSIDDFGTGYSSLSYLKSFPIDTLKIDQCFVRDMVIKNEDAALVKGIINLAHSLNLSVVAEGVENIEQKDFLVEHNCNVLQGYLFSKPLPAKEALRWLSLNPVTKERARNNVSN